MADRPKLLMTRCWPDTVEAALWKRCIVTVDRDDVKLTEDQLRQAMLDYDIICPNVSDRIDASMLSAPGIRVKLIANYGAGVDHIDLAAAKAAGIPVTNTPDVLTDATAEIAILLMLMVSRRASEGGRELRSGRWAGWSPTHLMGRSLTGKTLGLVGFGRIGQATAMRAARAFGMRIAYTGRQRAAPEAEAETDARFVPSLERLAAEADVLSLHCRGGPETHHLVNARLLARMKPSAMLINTARGSVVNEADLAQALARGTIGGAGLDVYEHEPVVHPALLELPNLVLLPHLGSATLETRAAMGMRVVANVDCFLSGEPLPDRVC
jgi:lactate dehydrogenase-like 2-hydroxyacid dehydrogenase